MAARRLTVSMVVNRSRRTLMPMLAALSSPSRSAVSAQALRMNIGTVMTRMAAVM